MQIDYEVVILAAGRGERMQSKIPKIFHKLGNLELIQHVINLATSIIPLNIHVVLDKGIKDSEFIKHIDSQKFLNILFQSDKYGTSSAIEAALPFIKASKLIVLFGDVPLILNKSLKALIELVTSECKISILSFRNKSNNQYGKLVTEGIFVNKIVEYFSCTNQEATIDLCNSGIMVFDTHYLKNNIYKITNENLRKEYCLTDIIEIANKDNKKVQHIEGKYEECLGVNTREDMARLEHIFQNRLRDRFMREGVMLLDPKTNYFSYDTVIGKDSIIHPNVFIGENVIIESDVKIFTSSNIVNAKLKQYVQVGPFASIKENSIICEYAKIGNFVEVKRSTIGKYSKVKHLSYIGDTIIGCNCNIGAGTIICNYDGKNKNSTYIGNNVFIGANNNLVAPLKIGNYVKTAAGSTITIDIQDQNFAIARSKQINYLKQKSSKI